MRRREKRIICKTQRSKFESEKKREMNTAQAVQKKAAIERIVKETTSGTTRSAYDAAERDKLLHEVEVVEAQGICFARNKETYATLAKATRREIDALRCEVSFSRFYAVIDFDSFYASVAELENPSLRHIPMVVVDGTGKIIETSNYKAREWGIRAGLPVFVGRALCKRGLEFGMPRAHLTVVEHRSERYNEVAEISREIFRMYDKNMIPKSIDEAFLDLTDCLHERGMLTPDGAQTVTHEIRQRILERTGLTTSAGIANNVTLAKICSSINKPNGQFCCPFTHHGLSSFLSTLDVSKVGGVGTKLAPKLAALGVTTCGDVLTHACMIKHVFERKPATVSMLFRVAVGLCKETDSMEREHKDQSKASKQETFTHATNDETEHVQLVEKLCGLLADSYFSKHKGAKSVQLTLTFSDFQAVHETLSFKTPLVDGKELAREATKIYKATYRKGAAVRHIGVSITLGNREAGQQSVMSFLESASQRPAALKRKR